eukprot:CAMPEP_0118987018 /NCGR_PEP_ID=MMETSP1173-20130426/43320_1 /TAXON_ID=1034831 /ORGANISM="Rhizochromulina marina cf, Strain CCMP1243" /LENGTH=50 /DNA_ID=CAMNT_0006937837 /DNA_START=36 /DNA_END=185 /DNA_ORIENTATION=+
MNSARNVIRQQQQQQHKTAIGNSAMRANKRLQGSRPMLMRPAGDGRNGDV